MARLCVLRMIEEQHHRDTDDRPLREIRTPPLHLRPNDIQHKTCPYPGARFQHERPMNASALRQASAHWSDIIDALALLRGLHAEQVGPVAVDAMHLWRVSQLGSALPWFYILRHGERAPGYAAALAKATQGVGIWAQRRFVEQLAGRPAPADWSVAALTASVEASGTLIGAVEVCAGPEAMLRRFFEAMLGGAAAVESAPVQRLYGERVAVMGFAAYYANFKLLLWVHALAREYVYADLLAALGLDHAAAPGLRALLGDGGDPPDFLMVRPPDPAAVARPARAAWLGGLARLVVPMAPDGSDRALLVDALAIALAAGTDDLPGIAELTAEVAAVAGLTGAAAVRAGLALATYARLDALLGELGAAIECGLRGVERGAVAPFDAASRDRLVVQAPRAALTALAPTALAALCPP